MKQEKMENLGELINKEYKNIAGIIVLKEGKTVYENYFNECTAASTIHIFSVTKSIISILIGIAIDKGYIKNVNQNVLDFFPEYTVMKGEKTLQNITLKHMLTMTAPYKFKSEPYTEYFTSENWVESSLNLLGGKEQIGEFRYAPLIGPDILSGILVNATGQSVLDFASNYLFKPLEINTPNNVIFQNAEEQFAFLEAKNVNGWVADPTGVNTAGWGLTLTTMDMAKIGQLYLNGGRWKEKQIVSESWVIESTKEQSRWEELNLSYGYLWWVDNGNEYEAMGDSGNTIYINTKNNMVVSIASLYMPDAKDRIEFIKEYIVPIYDN